MRVLAIIPACEGSTTLPNKNMRVLDGKPMIFYVIQTAKKSRLIGDIIVTSNSPSIISVAKKLGVLVRERSSALSNSETSLDEVVLDVFNQLDINAYDAVVTMQSISPLLKTDTLDKALSEFINDGVDTLISVRNQSHFYWQVKDGHPVPVQKERMNRHQLPPFYVETGAFLITKTQFIKKTSRIGDKVRLFELVGDEAIDVDDFGDLQLVENAMSRQSIAFYVNGYKEMGLGHISRVLQISDELFSKPDIYFDEDRTAVSNFGSVKYNLIPVKGDNGFVEAMSRKRYDVIINDVLNTSEEFMRSLRNSSPNSRIVNFEDDGSGAKYADVVINALYEKASGVNSVFGSKYFVIPKLFLLYDPIVIKEKISNVIVTFGGADPQNYSEMFLDYLERSPCSDIHFFLILGKANANVKRILERCSKIDNVSCVVDVDNMAEIMEGCDAAISSRGRTCFELASLGIPTLSIAQHAREELHTFVCEENGFICLRHSPTYEEAFGCLDHFLNLDLRTRLDMQAKMLKHDLKNGRKHIANLITQKKEN